jgi:hypothetical protein
MKHMIEQDHLRVKQRYYLMLGFKIFYRRPEARPLSEMRAGW